jgi:hypothetical protein
MLYRYCPFSLQEIENVLGLKIHFSSIENFNDPRDSRIVFDFDVLRKNPLSMPFLQRCQELRRSPKIVIDEIISSLQKRIAIACFSQKKPAEDDTTMWAYYAGKSSGMRIACDFGEFSTGNQIVLRENDPCFPVNYVEDDKESRDCGTQIVLFLLRSFHSFRGRQYASRPLKDFIDDVPEIAFSDHEIRENIIRCVTVKKTCWSPEREQRLIRFMTPGMSSEISLTRKSFFAEIALGPKSSKADRDLAARLFVSKILRPVESVDGDGAFIVCSKFKTLREGME